MKIKNIKGSQEANSKKFQPVDVTITIESEKEAKILRELSKLSVSIPGLFKDGRSIIAKSKPEDVKKFLNDLADSLYENDFAKKIK